MEVAVEVTVLPGGLMWDVRERGEVESDSKRFGQSYWKDELGGGAVGGKMRGGGLDMVSWRCPFNIQVETTKGLEIQIWGDF